MLQSKVIEEIEGERNVSFNYYIKPCKYMYSIKPCKYIEVYVVSCLHCKFLFFFVNQMSQLIVLAGWRWCGVGRVMQNLEVVKVWG